MRYRVVLRNAARRDLAALPPAVQQRIDPHIMGLADNPRPSGATKLRDRNNRYRIRVGDYCIIYDIEDDVCIVTVVQVGPQGQRVRTRAPSSLT